MGDPSGAERDRVRGPSGVDDVGDPHRGDGAEAAIVETERERLRLAVRGAAVASLSEAEFVRRVRGAGMAIWPRSRDADGAVDGFSIEFSIGSGRTHADRDLAQDLCLTALRAHWDVAGQAREQTLEEWQGLRAATDFDRERVMLSHPSMWSRMFADMGAFNSGLRRMPPDQRAGWAWAAGRLAGVCAVWSQRVGADVPALSLAATELGNSAQMAVAAAPTTSAAPTLSRVAFALAQLEIGAGDPARESLLLLVQLIAGVLEVSKAHRRRGELTRSMRLGEVGVPLGVLSRELHARSLREPQSRNPGGWP
ncbi:hypothetical protein ACTD5D_40090 [Nocardia takedensis]|uniref:hypothetical protein n=1 Tax=Nocardia takedensis TaxID=259390 RepID=UPI003F773184